jgi:hypothetical protein
MRDVLAMRGTSLVESMAALAVLGIVGGIVVPKTTSLRDRILVECCVTSNYHTARARRIYLSAEHERGGGPDLRVVASGDRFFNAGNWWHNREGRKTFLYEWMKTVASWVNL